MAENQEVQTEEQQTDEVETISKAEYDAIVAERDELIKYKPKEVSEEEKAIITKQQELWQKEVALTLKENNLERFTDVVNVSDTNELESVIETLSNALNEYKVDNAYVPKDHAVEDEYEKYSQNKDAKGMIASKFSKLFK